MTLLSRNTGCRVLLLVPGLYSRPRLKESLHEHGFPIEDGNEQGGERLVRFAIHRRPGIEKDGCSLTNARLQMAAKGVSHTANVMVRMRLDTMDTTGKENVLAIYLQRRIMMLKLG